MPSAPQKPVTEERDEDPSSSRFFAGRRLRARSSLPALARSMTLEEARLTTPAILALEDGSVFRGVAIGAPGTTVGEMVFNTAMTGYQEIATHPAHVRQLVALTCPHIGNVGTNPDDDDSAATAAGLIVRSGAMVASSFRSQEPLGDWLVRRGIVAIEIGRASCRERV